MDCVNQYRDALQAVFGPLDLLPIPDGTIHRFRVPGDKPGTLNGWYLLFLDGIACGVFGSWKAGGSHTWSSRQPTNPHETEQLRQRIEQARRQREAEQRQRQQSAADYANRLWRDARRADPEHPYLVAKGCRTHALRQSGDLLLVPLSYQDGLVNLQRIGPDGGKRFLFGGLVKGASSPLGLIVAGQPLYVCEGWATGSTLHAHSGAAVACAMNAGNLLPVALGLRAKNPGLEIIIAGDDDRLTPGNPGRAAAHAAAVAVGGQVVFPEWPAAAPDSLTDFNDLVAWSNAHGIA